LNPRSRLFQCSCLRCAGYSIKVCDRAWPKPSRCAVPIGQVNYFRNIVMSVSELCRPVLCVCRRAYLRNCTSYLRHFFGVLPMALGRSSSGGVEIFYLLPVLWADVMFAHNGQEYATRKIQQVSRVQQSATIASLLRELTRDMGSQSVTYHLAEVTLSPLPQRSWHSI